MTRDYFHKDAFCYSIANWAQSLVAIIITPIMVAYFTSANYGYMTLVNTIASFLYILGMFGVADQGLPRFFIDSTDKGEKNGYVASAYVITLVGNAVILFLLLFIKSFAYSIFKDISSPCIFLALSAITFLALSCNFLGFNLLRWTFQSRLFMLINISKVSLVAICTICGVVFLHWQAKETLFCIAIITILFGIWANVVVRHHVSFSMVSFIKIKQLLTYSMPLFLVNILAFLSLSFNKVLLVRLSNLDNLGVFSVSGVFANIFETAISGFFFAIGPYILFTYKESWAPKKYSDYFAAISAIGIIFVIILGLWGDPLVKLFRPDDTYQGIGVFIPYILSATIFYQLGVSLSYGPYISKKTYWSLILFAISTTLNVLLCYLLIPRWSIFGACIALSMSNLLLAVLSQIVSNKLYYVPNRWIKSFSIILLIAMFVSFLQSDYFMYNIDKFSHAVRLGVTILLLIIGICPFYKDITQGGIFRNIIFIVSKKL